MDRVANYSVLAAKLAQFSDEEVAELLAQSPQMHAGVGGRSVLLTLESTPIFVKKIPLTAPPVSLAGSAFHPAGAGRRSGFLG